MLAEPNKVSTTGHQHTMAGKETKHDGLTGAIPSHSWINFFVLERLQANSWTSARKSAPSPKHMSPNRCKNHRVVLTVPIISCSGVDRLTNVDIPRHQDQDGHGASDGPPICIDCDHSGGGLWTQPFPTTQCLQGRGKRPWIWSTSCRTSVAWNITAMFTDWYPTYTNQVETSVGTAIGWQYLQSQR